MRSLTASSLNDFHDAVTAESGQGSVFRGHKDRDTWELKPSVGRHIDTFDGDKDVLKQVEKDMFEIFEMESSPHLNYVPATDWEWLALAQHHGVPTRLLDWSHNALTALYFAVNEAHDGDSAVYILNHADGIRYIRPRTEEEDPDPFEITEVVRYLPKHLHPRITNQTGSFTAHPDPSEVFDSDHLVEIVVPEASRREIKQALYRYGISPKWVFPGLDGLASWLVATKIERLFW